jgi:hypothetical protein
LRFAQDMELVLLSPVLGTVPEQRYLPSTGNRWR